MRNKINWQEVKEEFEKEMAIKLGKLPGHKKVDESQRDFRNVISHEIPETAPQELFENLIKILLSNKKIDAGKIREKLLKPEIKKEEEILRKHKVDFDTLRKSAMVWVKKNLPEEQLQKEWKEHKTWLQRRFTIYKESNVAFQRIAIDTMVRFELIKIYCGKKKDV